MRGRQGMWLRALLTGFGVWSGVATPALAQTVLPAETDLQVARERMGAALTGVGTPSLSGRPVPEIRALPRPVGKRSDIASIADVHRPSQPLPGSLPAPDTTAAELMVFISFSLPRETLQRIINQSERSGAVLVLRGLKGNSLTRMGEEIAQLVGTRNVKAIIDPPAFRQFAVRQVPALVLARSGPAAKIGEDGGAPVSSFIRVDGDVSQDYALDLVERQAPAWAEIARRYSARLSGGEP